MFAYLWVFGPFTMCLVFKISAYPFGQVKIKMYLPESPSFKKTLAGASGLVLMSVRATTVYSFNLKY